MSRFEIVNETSQAPGEDVGQGEEEEVEVDPKGGRRDSVLVSARAHDGAAFQRISPAGGSASAGESEIVRASVLADVHDYEVRVVGPVNLRFFDQLQLDEEII